MIFMDSGYFKGLIIKRDSYRKFSHTIKPLLKNEVKVINITVLVEVLNSLKKNNYYGDVDMIIQQLCGLDVFDWLTSEDYKKAFEKFKFYNGAINFSDCTILVTRKNLE